MSLKGKFGKWQATNLMADKFIGKELPGFPYKRGDIIPPEKQYAAMLAHDQAKSAKHSPHPTMPQTP